MMYYLLGEDKECSTLWELILQLIPTRKSKVNSSIKIIFNLDELFIHHLVC